MNQYELALVINGQLGDEEKDAEFEKVKELVERFGGTITKIDDWGKKRLAYEIQKIKEGFYYFVDFDAEADVPVQIESTLRITENVLRYLIVRADD